MHKIATILLLPSGTVLMIRHLRFILSLMIFNGFNHWKSLLFARPFVTSHQGANMSFAIRSFGSSCVSFLLLDYEMSWRGPLDLLQAVDCLLCACAVFNINFFLLQPSEGDGRLQCVKFVHLNLNEYLNEALR